jgi:hypothetical protein
MRVWADIYDPTGVTRLGSGPITTVKNASVTRALDGAGSFSFTVPGTDERSLTLLRNKRRAVIWVEYNNKIREFGRGIIDKINPVDNVSGYSITVGGPSDLVALRNRNTGLARIYSNQRISDVVSSLAGLAGWSVSCDAAQYVSARFDGETVLKALQAMVSQQGVHLRESSASNTLEVGAFGDDSGLRCVHIEHADRTLYSNDKLLLIKSMSLTEDSKDLCNWLLPIGAGTGEATLTLKYSTRSVASGYPYDIKTAIGADGRILYYLADSDSIATYGQIDQIGAFKSIAPLSNTDADLVNASNALYDAAAAWLIRHKDVLETYSFSLVKVAQTLKPGQKIHVRYKGLIYRDNRPITYRDINADFWVMECTEKVDQSGIGLDLKIATIDRYEQDFGQVLIGALDALQINNLKVQPYPSTRSYVYDREIAPSFPAQVPIRITDSTLTLQRCAVRIKTSPFRSTAAGAASGGSATSSSGGAQTSTADGFINSSTNLQTVSSVPSDHNHLFTAPAHTHDVANHTHTTPNHTHPQSFSISDDTATPDTISIFVDGIDRTSALGGPFVVGGGNATLDLNAGLVTGYLVNASGGLRQEHILEIRCASGQGRSEIQVELYEVVQAIAVT